MRTREEVCKPGRSQLCSLLNVGLPASDCEKKNPCHLSACSVVFFTMAPGTNAVAVRGQGGPSIQGGDAGEVGGPRLLFRCYRCCGCHSICILFQERRGGGRAEHLQPVYL